MYVSIPSDRGICSNNLNQFFIFRLYDHVSIPSDRGICSNQLCDEADITLRNVSIPSDRGICSNFK